MTQGKKKSKMQNAGAQRTARPGAKMNRAKAKRVLARQSAVPGEVNRVASIGMGGKKPKAKAADALNDKLRPVAGARDKGKKSGVRREKPRTAKHPVRTQEPPLAA